MEQARPLRAVFAELSGDESARRAREADPEGFLAELGHGELPGSLLAEAIVSYADTAPAEVAEHLAPFVMAHSPVPLDLEETDPAHGLDLLASAPAVPDLDAPPADLDDTDALVDDGPAETADGVAADPFDFDFGQGDAEVAALDELDQPAGVDQEAAPAAVAELPDTAELPDGTELPAELAEAAELADTAETDGEPADGLDAE